METVLARDVDRGHFDPRAAGDPKMGETRLRSTEVPPKGVQMVGVVDDDALFLAPVSSVFVMRPDVSHLDASLKPPPEAVPKGRLQKVQLQFSAPRDTSRLRERKSTYAFLAHEEEKESWVDMAVFGPGSIESVAVKSSLYKSVGAGVGAGAGAGAAAKARRAAAAADTLAGGEGERAAPAPFPRGVPHAHYARRGGRRRVLWRRQQRGDRRHRARQRPRPPRAAPPPRAWWAWA